MNNNKWMIVCPKDSMSECSFEAQFDTRASLNFMTEGMVQDLGLEKKRLAEPVKFDTAAGEFICDFHVFADWRGRPGSQGCVQFYVLPERFSVTKPLIGTDDQDCWDGLLDEQPKDVVLYTALSKQKVSLASFTIVICSLSDLYQASGEDRERCASRCSAERPSRTAEQERSPRGEAGWRQQQQRIKMASPFT